MKKIFLVAVCIVANLSIISCTNDEAETTPNGSNKTTVVADGGGQNAPITPPRPK